MTRRRDTSDQFKVKVALEALRGARTIQEKAAKLGHHAGRHRACRLMKIMGLEAIYKRPKAFLQYR